MSSIAAKEQDLAAPDAVDSQRARHAMRRVERAREIAAEKEQAAQTAAERWLVGNARAVGSLTAQLDEVVAKVRANPNARDIEATNVRWAKIMRRLELADVVTRRFPGCKTPTARTVMPPGRRGLDVVGLSIALPQRQLFPLNTVSDSPKMRAAIVRYAAWEWLREHAAELSDDLWLAIESEPAEPDDHNLTIRRRRPSLAASPP
jgi:hypothetical protein